MILKYKHNFLSKLKRFFTGRISTSDKVAVIALHKLGDTVFTIQAIKYLHEKYGERLQILCYPESKTIYDVSLNLNITGISQSEFMFSGRAASFSARRKIANLNPKLIYDLTGEIRSFTLLFGNTSAEIIGRNKNIFASIYNHLIDKKSDETLVDNYMDIASAINPDGSKDLSKYKIMLINKGDLRSIAIHPFAGWAAKEWNLHKFIQLAEMLNSKYTVELIFPAGTIEKDVAEYLDKTGIKYSITHSIESLIETIKRHSIFIGNDSGPLYIAALLGLPTFTIYGPTNVFHSKPFGDYHWTINKNLKCSPKSGEQYCFTFAGRIGCPAYECMNQLKVSEVEEKFNDFMIYLNEIN